jgi:hypothetical protein
MAIIFLALAVIVGVTLGDAVLSNTGPGSAEVFNRSITDFTQGQLLVIAAGLGFLFAFFLFLAWSSSVSRRAKRRERRLVQRDLQGRVDELHRENASLREELDRSGRTGAFPGEGTTASEPAPPLEERERVAAGRSGSIRDRFRGGDRVEEPARPER